MILYCLHDKKAGSWSFPATTHNAATAIRDFEQMAKRPDFPVPDLDIVQVGTFDPDTGVIVPGINVILSGSDYAKV